MIKYKFTYPEVGIEQFKYLVDEQTYSLVKEIVSKIKEEEDKNKKDQNKALLIDLNKTLSDLIGDIDFNLLITREFRSYRAIESGEIEPWFDGMKPMKVIVEKV